MFNSILAIKNAIGEGSNLLRKYRRIEFIDKNSIFTAEFTCKWLKYFLIFFCRVNTTFIITASFGFISGRRKQVRKCVENYTSNT